MEGTRFLDVSSTDGPQGNGRTIAGRLRIWRLGVRVPRGAPLQQVRALWRGKDIVRLTVRSTVFQILEITLVSRLRRVTSRRVV
jgi:hypothetical protein